MSDVGGAAARRAESRRAANRALLMHLTALWDAVPDQRFGQLVMNLSRTDDGFADTWEWSNAEWRHRFDEAWQGWASRASRSDASWPAGEEQ